jgi:hypothetical protein
VLRLQYDLPNKVSIERDPKISSARMIIPGGVNHLALCIYTPSMKDRDQLGGQGKALNVGVIYLKHQISGILDAFLLLSASDPQGQRSTLKPASILQNKLLDGAVCPIFGSGHRSPNLYDLLQIVQNFLR